MSQTVRDNSNKNEIRGGKLSAYTHVYVVRTSKRTQTHSEWHFGETVIVCNGSAAVKSIRGMHLSVNNIYSGTQLAFACFRSL